MIIKAYTVPHPPIILPEVGRGEEKKIQNTIDAMDRMGQEIAELAPETIIITSPHAPLLRDGFFVADGAGGTSNFIDFGAPQVVETVSYDEELIETLKNNYKNRPLFSIERFSRGLDHATFVPIYFIHKYYKDFKVLRLGLSGYSAVEHYRLGMAIKESVEALDRRAVFVASGDLSHVLKADGPYGFREAGPVFDKKIVDILSRAAFDELIEFPEDLMEAAAQCGTRSFQIMAGALDGVNVEGELYSYEGPFGVGYSVVGFTPEEQDTNRCFLAEESEDKYIDLARETIVNYVNDGQIISIPKDLPAEMLDQRAGVFVTLHKDGYLRGCIGTTGPTTGSIAEEIRQNAISSSTQDPRFPAVGPEELDSLEISVDVLKASEKIQDLSQLDPKRYGVIVSRGFRRGLLLPNIEGVDDPESQVNIALKKAGIQPSEDYELERFEVIRHE